MPTSLHSLKTQIFADGADSTGMIKLYKDPLIKGMTTNPTLMKKAGITNYESFAKDILKVIKEKPISFEVFSDEFSEMKRQAILISSWQDNVYVKIPITNSRGESSIPLIKELSRDGVKLNITAILTLLQVEEVVAALNPKIPSIISVFAGRIADTGLDPMPIMRESLTKLKKYPNFELLWASVREVINIFQAEQCGCHIVTVPHDILNKALRLVGMDLTKLSLDTVQMFKSDADQAGFSL